MSENLPLCVFTEGHITLPDHYQDRTVNVFTLPGENTPAFNISRDSMNDDETLSAYIDLQLTLMQKHLKGWNQTERVPAITSCRVNVCMPATCVTVNVSSSNRRYLTRLKTIFWCSL